MAWTTPRTWNSAEVVTKTIMDTHIRDNLNAMSAWTSYTPTWTGTGGTPTVGNGTLSGSYLSYGGVVMVRISLTWGSTTAAAGITAWKFALPVAPSSAGILPGMVVDTGVAQYPAVLSDFAGSAGVLRVGTGLTPASNTSPMTWGTGDNVIINGTYIA